jgi:Protein of unknown function (DUF3025)
MRYQAPSRDAIDPQVWRRPPLDSIAAAYPWIAGPGWPSIAELNVLLGARSHALTGLPLCFVEQTPALLRDGLHYEQRSFERGAISTRADNWHDLFNALIWIEYTALKSAINARYAAELSGRQGKERSRAQMAITHFDEGGAIVLLRDPALVAYWDRHDWHGLFWTERAAWKDGRIQVVVFGHAMLEHALMPHQVVTAKCVLAGVAKDESAADAEQRVLDDLAERIRSGGCLNDPQELRPLPLSGIPGWHDANREESFYRSAECFRPLRPGRVYPPPL